MAIVYLGLGTNLEPRFRHLQEALQTLEQRVGTLLKCSSFMETEPWGFVSEHKFLNAAACFDTVLSPTDLLKTTEEIERSMGRTHKSKFGKYEDRTIDIDILLYDEVTICSEELTIPHPRLHLRDFVLFPLEEIAPNAVHPTLGKAIRQLAIEFRKKETTDGTKTAIQRT